jgi:hypothetical protein
MSVVEPDPASEPIRVAEVTVATYRWDELRAAVERAFTRAQRTAVVVAVGLSAAVAVAGLVLLPSASKVSVAIYTPLVGWGAWSWLRVALARRASSAAVAQARELVVPALVDTAGRDALVVLLRLGGALVTERSTTIIVDRRDSSVALVASEYDLRHVPFGMPGYSAGP